MPDNSKYYYLWNSEPPTSLGSGVRAHEVPAPQPGHHRDPEMPPLYLRGGIRGEIFMKMNQIQSNWKFRLSNFFLRADATMSLKTS